MNFLQNITKKNSRRRLTKRQNHGIIFIENECEVIIMIYDAEAIRQELLKQFEGKDATIYSNYSPWIIGRAVATILKTLGYDTNEVFAYQDRFNVSVRYKGESFAYIECKRKKGDTHYMRFGGSKTDYTWKDFAITLHHGSDLEAAYLGVKQVVEDREQKKSDDEVLAYDVYKFLRDTFPNHDSIKFYKLINILKTKEYDFAKKYNEEKNSQ